MYIIAAIQYSIWFIINRLVWYNIYQNANTTHFLLSTNYKHKSCDNLLASELNVNNLFSTLISFTINCG